MNYILKYSNKKLCFLSICLSFILSSTNTFTSIFFSKTIEFTQTKNSNGFLLILLLATLTYLTLFVINLIHLHIINKIIFDVNTSLKFNILKCSLYNADRDDNLINLITNDWKLFEQNYLKNIFIIFQLMSTFFISLSVSLFYNIEMTLYFVIFSFVPFCVPIILKNKIQMASKKWSNTSSAYIKSFSNMISGEKNIQIFGVQIFCLNKNRTLLINNEKSFKELNIKTGLTSSLSSTLGTLCFLFPILIGGYKVLNGSLSLTILIALIQISNSIVNPLITLTSLQGNFHSVKPILDKIKTSLHQSDNKLKLEKQITTTNKMFFQDFSILRNGIPIFCPINIDIIQKDKVLIKGKSGVGKSTLLNFIKDKSQYDFQGKCSIQDNKLDTKVLQLTQDPFIFDMSLKDNICLGLDIPEEDYINLLTSLNLNHLTVSIDSEKHLATILSGGEKQRVCLARILIRNPDVLLLDEVTAALDDHSANEINKIIDALNITVIEVAHKNIDLNRYTKILHLEK